MKRQILALIILMLLCFTAGCALPKTDPVQTTSAGAEEKEAAGQTPPAATPDEPTPAATPDEPQQNGETKSLEELMANTIQATITMEDGGQIVLELYPDLAPQSVRNFVYLARKGFYNGLKFHRIMKGFMIQGGDPLGIGMGGPGYSIKGEFSINGFANDLSHTRGVLSMARSRDYDSAGSQFFIMHEDRPGPGGGLDGAYAAFGKVISGMDVVDKIAETPNIGGNGEVAAENMPVMKSVTIDDDSELPEPDMLK